MSTVVDSRLVEMSFDNSDFEKNVKTSLNTLGKLNDDLDNITDSASGMTTLGKAIDGISFGGLESAAAVVGERFNALSIIAISALNRITNQAMAAGEQLVKSLSIQQIQAGWDKYAQKTEAVQTIMSATASSWEKNAEALGFEGTQMEFVSEQLEKLNWFSDETSYSFTDMTSNIGKFTSAGVSLTDAVTAMEGISTWAAKSGQNTQSASRAMYNLSQAMSVGVVKLMDWRSIENANMATQEFKQTAIDTAVALGTLKEVGDGVYKTMANETVTVTDFNSRLQDEWFTANVLMQTLTKYGKGATKLSEICEDYGVTASQFLAGMEDYNKGTKTIDDISTNLGINMETLIPLFDELNSEEYKLGISSFKAAQEAKTFTEALDATKDAVSTGWMTTFETIFGNYEEAKVLWTDLANALWDVFAAGGEERNQLLSDWKEYGAIIGGGRDDLIEAFWDIWDAVGAVFGTISEAFRNVFPKTTFGDLIKYVKAFKSFAEGLMIGEETADKLNRAFTGLFSVLDIGFQIFKALFSVVDKVFSHFAGYSSDVLDVAASIGDWLTELDNTIKELGIFEQIADKIANVIIIIGEWINKAFTITPIQAFNKGIYDIYDVLAIVETELQDFGQMFVDVIKELTGIDIVEVGNEIAAKVEEFGGTLYSKFDEVFTKITGISFGEFTSSIESIFTNIVAGIKKVATTIGTVLGTGLGAVLYGAYETITFILTSIGEKMAIFVSSSQNVAAGISSVFDSIMESAFFKFLDAVFITIGATLAFIWDMIKTAGQFILGFMKELAEDFSLSVGDGNLFETIRVAIQALLEAGIINSLKELLTFLSGIKIADTVTSLADAIGSIGQKAEETNAEKILKVAVAVGILAASLYAVSMLDSAQLSTGITTITSFFAELLLALKGAEVIMAGSVVNISIVASGLLKLSAAVMILTLAMKMLAGLNPDQITMGITAIGALIAELTAAAFGLSKVEKGIVKGGATIIALATSMIILAGAMKIIASISLAGVIKSLGSIGALLFAVVKTTELIKPKRLAALGSAMMPLATGFLILSVAMKIISGIDLAGLAKGLSAFGISLYFIASLSKFVKPKKLAALASAMIPLATGFLILSAAMKVIEGIELGGLAKGLLTLASTLFIMGKMGKLVGEETAGIVALSGSMILLGTGMLILAAAMRVLEGADITNGLVAIGSITTLMALLSTNMVNPAGVLALAGAMMMLGLAFAILVPELLILGSMPFGSLVKSLSLMAGVILILAVAGSAIMPIIPGILALAGAFAAVGAAVALFGIGVAALSAGLTILATLTTGSVVAILASIEVLILGIINLLPTIASGLAVAVASLIGSFKIVIKPLMELLSELLGSFLELLINFIPPVLTVIGLLISGLLELINENVPLIFDTLGIFLDEFLAFLREYIPEIVDLVGDLLLTLIATVATYIPLFIQSAVDIITGILGGIASAIPQIVEAGVEVVRSFLVGIASALVGVIDAAFEMIVTFIDGLATAIEERGPELREAIMHLITAIVTNIIDLGVDLISVGAELIAYLVTGLLEGISNVAAAVWEIISTAASTVAGFFSRFLTYGKTLIIKLKNGIVSMATSIATSAGDLITGAIDAISGFFGDLVEVGHNIVQGIIDGIVEWAQNLWDSITDLADGALAAIKDALGIASPSKEMYEVGKYFDEGFVKGIDGFAGQVNNASEKLGRSTLNTMLDVLKDLSDELSENDEFNPVITPVLDLTNLQRDASSISSMLGGNNRMLQLASSITTGSNDNKNNQNGGNSAETAGTNPQTYQFIQNNYSPKALSRIDIYRQTSNQFAFMKGMVGGGA